MHVLASQVTSASSAGPLAAILNIWLAAWAIRRKGEFDYQLDQTAKAVRWILVAVCLGLPFRIGQLLNPTMRVCLGIAGIAFLVWPNLAYHMTRFLRLIKVLPTGPPESLTGT
jgi:hypothetical protein